MNNKVAEFFHRVSPYVIAIVQESFRKDKEVTYKTDSMSTLNFVTQTDIAVENYLVREIKENFPNVLILSEEGYSKTSIPDKGLLWIIDPICGTGNFARDIPIFVTNIAVIKDGITIAACAIDHAQKEYIWSIGNNEIYINNILQDTKQKTEGIVLDIDLIVVPRLPMDEREKYATFIKNLLIQETYTLLSYTSSLNFSYASLGRLDGYVSPINYVWDVATANFFMTQVGGIVTELSGEKWGWNSTSVLSAGDPQIHAKLLHLLNS